jgi:hypothetical protein
MTEREIVGSDFSGLTASHRDFISGGRNVQGGIAWYDLANIYTFHTLREEIRIGSEPLPLVYLSQLGEIPSEERSKSLMANRGRKFANTVDRLVVESLKQMLVLIDTTSDDLEAVCRTLSTNTGLPKAFQPKAVRLHFWRGFVDRTIGPVSYRLLDKI